VIDYRYFRYKERSSRLYMSIYEVFDMSIALWLEIISPLLTILMAEL
jgi:hypothetical protein